jgi:hypothetical protein
MTFFTAFGYFFSALVFWVDRILRVYGVLSGFWGFGEIMIYMRFDSFTALIIMFLYSVFYYEQCGTTRKL